MPKKLPPQGEAWARPGLSGSCCPVPPAWPWPSGCFPRLSPLLFISALPCSVSHLKRPLPPRSAELSPGTDCGLLPAPSPRARACAPRGPQGRRGAGAGQTAEPAGRPARSVPREREAARAPIPGLEAGPAGPSSPSVTHGRLHPSLLPKSSLECRGEAPMLTRAGRAAAVHVLGPAPLLPAPQSKLRVTAGGGTCRPHPAPSLQSDTEPGGTVPAPPLPSVL